MKALYQSTWFRFVLLLALTVAILAAVGVNADDAQNYWLLYSRSDGGSLQSIKDSGTYTGAFYSVGLRAEIPYYKNSTYIITADINYNSISPSREDFFTNNTYAADYSTDVWSNVTSGKGNLFNNITSVLNYLDNNTVQYILTFHVDDSYSFNTATFKYYWFINTIANFNFNYVDMNVYYTNDPDLTEHQEIVNKLNEIIDNQRINNNEINTALNNIINNQIIQNNNWTTIINYGSNYNQIDQTTINNFGTAQDNLSSAEGALQDKSQSLRDGVSSQWQNNINTTKNFVSTITPATTAITSTMTQIVAIMPEEVQALLIVIPLLLFIGWLIGRIEGG